MKIGVLGGIGPESSATFYLKLVEELQKKNLVQTNEDYPQIIINSVPAKELIFEKIEEKDLDSYIKGLKELDKLKPDFIIMVCNTIHLFLDELQSHIETPILDLRREVLRTLKERNFSIFSVIGTPNTVSLGLYDFPDIEQIGLEKEDVNILSDTIVQFLKRNNKEKQLERTKQIVNKQFAKGAETIILGCTEFAVMFQDENISKIDTIDVLVQAIVNKMKSS